MRIELFALCDFAQTEASGKLNLLGAFDRIQAADAPVTRSVCAIAARIRFEAHEEGQRTVSLRVIDSDGQRVVPPIRAQFPVKMPANEASVVLNYVMVIPQMKIPRFGDYQIDLAVDDKVEASIPLFVRQRPAAPPHA